MRDAFIFFYDPSLLNKAKASIRGVRHIATYRSGISRNLDLIRETSTSCSTAQIALGGPAVRIFPEWLQERIPAGVNLFPEESLERFFASLGLRLPENPVEPDPDPEAMETAFPQWREYREEIIGVRTKQGCPLDCLFCAYGFLEGKRIRRREPARVVREIADYVHRWGARRFWFVDAQLLSGDADREHLKAVLGGLQRDAVRSGAGIQWSGYLRIDGLDRELAGLMVRSGLHDLEVSLNSGSQKVLDQLRMGFSPEDAIRGVEVLKSSGYSGRLLVNLSLNAPGETRETLLETIGVVKRIRLIFGDERVVPVIFFLAIQPHTGLERRALSDGHISEGYNPLSVSPWNILKLIYNPPPLDRVIGRCCAESFSHAEGAGGWILGELEKALARV
jgi:radical SAM superfamily enzyme YgiQ (UPF0313 family)